MSGYLPASRVAQAQAEALARTREIDEERLPERGYPHGTNRNNKAVRWRPKM